MNESLFAMEVIVSHADITNNIYFYFAFQSSF